MKKKTGKTDDGNRAEEIAPPIDVVDGIPDRAANRPNWKRILLVAAFLAWTVFLAYCGLN